MTKWKPTTAIGKFLLSFVRTFPEIVMAILFIKAVGPGAFSGVLDLGVHSIGMFGKLFSEVIESMDLKPAEALTACGANSIQRVWFAVIPQVLPEFALEAQAWSRVGIILLGIIIMATLIDIVSGYIRRKTSLEKNKPQICGLF